ncbi:hypothetical protein LTR64_008671 [Lithohypha guttulata]|uniref:uncharacterized protein n=1 Tax=Lithohypha guttulata TaxID=1690604 RepID=UPI00315D4680
MSDSQDNSYRYESITISGEARAHLGDVYPSHPVIRDGDSHNYPRTDVRGGFVIQGNNYGTMQLPQPEYDKPLPARVLEKLSKLNSRSTTLFFFFSANDPGRQNHQSMIRALLSQLYQSSGIPQSLLELYKRYSSQSDCGPSITAELSNIFVEFLMNLKEPLYLVLDGLDEVGYGPQRAEVVQLTQQLVALRQPQLHIFLTSRSEADILGYFEESEGWISLPADHYKISGDIKIYVEQELCRYPDLKRLPSNTKEMIRKRLCRRDNIMFQWTVLQLDRIKFMRGITSRKVQNLLHDLPASLDETYTKILQSIPQEDRSHALMTLKCLILARRPLKAEELQDLVNFSTKTDRPHDHYESLGLMDIFCLLPSMILLDPWPRSGILEELPKGQHTVLLGHFSVQEFLTGNNIRRSSVPHFLIEPGDSHKQLSLICIRYLMANNTLEKRNQRYRLREYAWEYWSDHAILKEINSTYDEVIAARLLFSKVSYYSLLESIPVAILQDFSTDELRLVQRSLQKPYFRRGFINYPGCSFPLPIDDVVVQDLLLKNRLQQLLASDGVSSSTMETCSSIEVQRTILAPLKTARNSYETWSTVPILVDSTKGISDNLDFRVTWEFQEPVRMIFTITDAELSHVHEIDHQSVMRINSVPIKVSPILLRYLHQQARSGARYLWADEICLPLSRRLEVTASQSTIGRLQDIHDPILDATSPHQIDERHIRNSISRAAIITLLCGELSCNLSAYKAACYSLSSRGSAADKDYDTESAWLAKTLQLHGFEVAEYVFLCRTILHRLATFSEALAEFSRDHMVMELGSSVWVFYDSFVRICDVLNFLQSDWAEGAPHHALVSRALGRPSCA